MRNEEQSFFNDPEFKEALATYEAMVRRGVSAYMDAGDLTDIAEYYMTQGREKEATRCIDLAIQLHPDSPDPQVFLAREQMFKGNVEEACRLCDQIPAQDDREVIFLRAELLLRQQRAEEAFCFLQEVYDQTDDEPHLFLHDCIDLCFDYYYYEQALEWSKLLLARHPGYKPVTSLLADSYTQTGHPEQAIDLLEDALTQDPYMQDGWLLMAEAYSEAGRYEEAVDAADYALAIKDDDIDALAVKADCLYHANRPVESHECYMQLLQHRPTDEEALYYDSVCLATLARYDEALMRVEVALENHPDHTSMTTQLLVQHAYLLSKQHRLDEALASLARCRDISTEADHLDFYLIRGHVFLENDMRKEALADFEQAMEEAENKNNALTTIAVSLCECQCYEESCHLLEMLLEENEENDLMPECLAYLSFCYYALGRYEELAQLLPRALKADRETTVYLISPVFPDAVPEEYEERARHLALEDQNILPDF